MNCCSRITNKDTWILTFEFFLCVRVRRCVLFNRDHNRRQLSDAIVFLSSVACTIDRPMTPAVAVDLVPTRMTIDTRGNVRVAPHCWKLERLINA